jgi:hypothetical protein
LKETKFAVGKEASIEVGSHSFDQAILAIFEEQLFSSRRELAK